MNITNLDATPKTSASKAVEASGQTPPENGGGSTQFANALKDQESLLKENSKSKVEQTATQPTAAKPAHTDEETVEGDDDGQMLADFLEKYLPPFIDNGPQPNINDNIVPPTLPVAEGAPASPVANTLPAELTVPLQVPEMGNSVASAATTPTMPMPESVKTAAPEETMPASVTLQKTAVFGQSTPANQGVNPLTTEGADSFKQVLAAQSESGQKMPEITTEMVSNPRPIETRVENLTIAKPISHPAWGRDLGEHILWLSTKEVTAAEIRLNPAHLGPISVRIDLTQDNQASIQFAAQHLETREAIESSLPKLKEMLQGQQLNLVNVNISQNSSSNQGHAQQRAFAGTANGQNNRHLDAAATHASEINENEAVVSKGLLSLYA